MNFNQIELLRLLRQTDFNLSKAGEKMHLVQSAVSRQLQMLESELGAPLFERQGKRLLGLTVLGEAIMTQVEQIHLSKANIQSLAEDFRDSRNGMLRVATTHAQAKYLLPGPVQRFLKKFPNIKIYMVQSSPDNLLDMLHQHQVDIAICTEKLADDDKLIVRPCYPWHHVAVIPGGHALAEGDLTLQRLAQFPILTYIPGFTGRGVIEQAFAQAGLQPDIILAAADSDIIKTYVRLGLGVGIIAGAAYEMGRDADLHMRDLGRLMPTLTTKIAYLKPLYLPAYYRFFIDELVEAGRQRALLDQIQP